MKIINVSLFFLSNENENLKKTIINDTIEAKKEREYIMRLAREWKDYEIIDASNGEKLERWGNIVLLRPSPEIIWNQGNLRKKHFHEIDAIYNRSNKGGGSWENLCDMPERWTVSYKHLKFNLKQMGFKHTGLFPEQAVNWDYVMDKITNSDITGRSVKILNLFGYTGAASVAALSKGADVVHVDSSKGMNEWCKENVALNKLQDKNIRYLTDDVLKFLKREIRRGNKYDGIIMDPPSYGKGANGEIWTFENNINELLDLTSQLLSDEALFLLVNSYSAGISGTIIENMLKIKINKPGTFKTSEIGLKITNNNLTLPCGVTTIWER